MEVNFRDEKAAGDYWDKVESEGVKNTFKHFDRTHDRLFTINSVVFAAFIALSKLNNNIPSLMVLIPLVNFVYLLFIEYYLMEYNRWRGNIKNHDINTLSVKDEKKINQINSFSLLSIIISLLVFLIFVYVLIGR